MLLKRLEAERRARAIVVPTNKDEVRADLRSLGQPVRLFGEGLADIRERLRELRARIEIEGEEVAMGLGFANAQQQADAAAGVPTEAGAATMSADGAAAAADKKAKAASSDVYSEASAELVAARAAMLAFSTAAAQKRLADVKRRRDDTTTTGPAAAADDACRLLYGNLKQLAISGSQLGDDRPLACVRVSPSSTRTSSSSSSSPGPGPGGFGLIASGALAPTVKLWDAHSLAPMGHLVGHTERCTGLDWHPRAFCDSSSAPPLLATASADGTAKIWRITAGGDRGALNNGNGDESGDRMVEDNGTGSAAATTSMGLEAGASSSSSSSSAVVQSYLGPGGGAGGGKGGSESGGRCEVTLKGHAHRLGMVGFHPAGELVGTASFDRTWRLWHVETGKELLLQVRGGLHAPMVVLFLSLSV